MNPEAEARAFAARYPTPASHPYGGDGDWDQDCGRVMFRFAEWLGWQTHPAGDISSAYRVAMASGPLHPDPHAAPPLAWHFWDIGGPANGHVAQQIDDNTLVFMGSDAVWEDLGVGIGFSSVAAYHDYRPWAVYLGWATNYAGGTLDTSGLAGLDPTPIEREDIMASKDEVKAAFRELLAEWFGAPGYALDVARRENRLRLYRNVETGHMVALDPELGGRGVVIGPWDAAADPGKAVSLRVNYALTADLPEQAKALDNRQWANLFRDLGIPLQ